MGRFDLAMKVMKSAGTVQTSQWNVGGFKEKVTPGNVEVVKGSLVKLDQKLLIPSDREMWSNFMVELVRSKLCVGMSDSDLKNVIHRARSCLARKTPTPITREVIRDLPTCFYWDETEVADWFAEQGFEYLKEAFILNRITGRRLVGVDANALVKIGVRNPEQIRKITAKIRELIGVPRPNMMRALMRIPPFETFLSRLQTTKPEETFSFRKFCEDEGFPYDYLQYFGTNAQIPCTCEVTITAGRAADSPESSSASSESGSSIANVPTVECVARTALAHNKVVQQLIEEILASLFEGSKFRNIGKVIGSAIDRGYSELSTSESERDTRGRLNFAAEVARGLIEEMQRAALILNDIQLTIRSVQQDISPEQLSDMRMAASMFMEEVYPLAALMSLGEFTLESIFRQEPEFIHIVQSITDEAERLVDEAQADATILVDEVISEAEKAVVGMML